MIRSLVLIICLSLAVSCGDSDANDPNPYPGGPAVCPSGPEAPAASVEGTFSQTKAGPNAVKYYRQHAYVVESLNNTISKVDLATGERTIWVDVGNDRNPYDMWIGTQRTYITNYLGNSLTVVETATGEVIREVESELFRNPSGVAEVDGRIYVSNVNYQGPGQPFGDGSIVVIDSDLNVLGAIPTAQKNPQYLNGVSDMLIISDSGDTQFDQGIAIPKTGAVEFWTTNDAWDNPDKVVVPLEPNGPYGAPGRPVLGHHAEVLYLGSGTGSAIFAIATGKTEWLFGPDDPIVLPGASGNALTQVVGAVDGVVYAVSFNDDRFYGIDTSCFKVITGPIDLGTSTLVEGPIDAVLQPTGEGSIIVTSLMSVSNSLNRMILSW